MISKTEMLEAMELVDARITEVLWSWVKNEGNNLQGFIENPSTHVNYNPYVIMDFGKLATRVQLLKGIEDSLYVITEYKRGNPDYTGSMYEAAIDRTHVDLVLRLLDWLKKRFTDMTKVISKGNASDIAPTDEYLGMFTFNQAKFMEEYIMYKDAIAGCTVVVQYKKEQMQLAAEAAKPIENAPPEIDGPILTSNEPPL